MPVANSPQQNKAQNPSQIDSNSVSYEFVHLKADQDLSQLIIGASTQPIDKREIYTPPSCWSRDYLPQYESDGGTPRRRPIKKIGRAFSKPLKEEKAKKREKYMEMLEFRVKQLLEENFKLQTKNNRYKQLIKRFNESDQIVSLLENQMKGFHVNRQKIYDTIEMLCSKPIIDEAKIKETVMFLRECQGALGSDRTRAVDYLFQQMCETTIPDIQKYLVIAAQRQTDIFDPNYLQSGVLDERTEPWRREMITNLNLTRQHLDEINKLSLETLQAKSDFDTFFDKLVDMKRQLRHKVRNIEVIFDRLHNFLTPVQIARCLSQIQKHRFDKGLSLEIFSQSGQVLDKRPEAEPFDQQSSEEDDDSESV